jgi:hypothetical protein
VLDVRGPLASYRGIAPPLAWCAFLNSFSPRLHHQFRAAAFERRRARRPEKNKTRDRAIEFHVLIVLHRTALNWSLICTTSSKLLYNTLYNVALHTHCAFHNAMRFVFRLFRFASQYTANVRTQKCTALSKLHCIALHCIALHCIALHCIALHCVALMRLASHIISFCVS